MTKEVRKFDIADRYSKDPKRPRIFPVTSSSRMFIEYFEERGKCSKYTLSEESEVTTVPSLIDSSIYAL